MFLYPGGTGAALVISSIQELQYMSGPPLLMKSAMDAVREWRYKPTMLNGDPVEVDTTISVVFSLGG